MKKLLGKHTSFYVLLAVVFFAISFYFHSIGEYSLFRTMRALICFSSLGLLLYYRRKKVSLFIAIFILCYGISSFATVWYENALIATLSMALNLIAFIFLIFALWPKVNFRSMNVFLLILFIALVLINGYLLIEFVRMMRDFTLSNSQYLFMLLGAMATVIAGFLALLYNHRFSSRSSLLLVLFILAIIFAEVFRGIAYYDFAYGNVAVHTARGLLILGVLLMIAFERAEKKEEERLNQKLF